MTSDTKGAAALEAVATQMALAIDHRGPDDAGAWADAASGFALGHRRLSIVDLSKAGHQPMHSASQRFVVAFNGEIYNHLALRSALEAQGCSPQWRGHSDTETLLAGCETWGLEETLKRSVGMFAIALWDTHTHTMHLARDRFGEKPLYYGWAGSGVNSTFIFGSELKALRAYPGFSNEVSREALALYMRFTYVPAPLSIYQNIYKLEPGCLLTLSDGFPVIPHTPLRPSVNYKGLHLHRWWDLSDVVEQGAATQCTDDIDAVNLLEHHLQDAVQLQSLADVPLGAFLSGGIDSSTIVALMQQQSMRPIKTFTVGFEEAGFDESKHARAVASYLGTEHHEMFVTAAEAQAVIPHLPDIFDEPFADSSQIPTHLVCKAASTQVKVALSGDAGDELFGGYNRYVWGPRIWRRIEWLPYQARQTLGAGLQNFPIPILNLLAKRQSVVRPAEKLHKLGRALTKSTDFSGFYLSLVSEWLDPAAVVKGCESDSLGKNSFSLEDSIDSLALKMMFQDAITYLPDDILCKVDRSAMASSLETRVPFLDHRVVEMAWRLPLNLKIHGDEGKWALRQVLYKHVPKNLVERPKAGFAIPLGKWLRGPLKPWAEALLEEKRLISEGYFYPQPIRSKWAEHIAGYRDHAASIWSVLMFQAWLERA